MHPGFLLAILTGFLWSGTGILFSRIAKNGHDFIGIRVRSALLAAVGGWILFARFPLGDPGPVREMTRLATVLFPGTLVGTVGFYLMNKAMARGHNGAAWTLGQSAMVIPFLAAVLIWDEVPTPLKAAGVGCVLAAMGCFGFSREKAGDTSTPADGSRKTLTWFPFALGAFVAIGCLQISMTLPSHWENWEDVYHIRVPVLLTGMALGNLLIRLFQKPRDSKRPWGYVIANVAIALTGQQMMFKAMDLLAETGQAGLAFPVAINACVLGFSAYSLFLIREPTNRYHLAGMGLGLIGILLMTWP